VCDVCLGGVFGAVLGLVVDEPGLLVADVLAAGAVASCGIAGPEAISSETTTAAARRANLKPGNERC
jgi:hypothetical protein